jgi:hypothetical protein
MTTNRGQSGRAVVAEPTNTIRPADAATRRRKSLLTNAVVLLLAAAALLCFIAVLADVRRVGNAMRHAAAQAEWYASRTQGTGVLPLNLDPNTAPGIDRPIVAFEWITTDQAMDLRTGGDPVLAAWSPPILRLFGADGRAVVLFDQGRFSTVWMSLADFESGQAVQRRRLEQTRSHHRP